MRRWLLFIVKAPCHVDFIPKRRHVKDMRFRLFMAIALCFLARLIDAEAAFSEPTKAESSFNIDFSASGLLPVTWAQDSPTLPAYGLGLQLGLEYDSTLSVPFRIELGYIAVEHSQISSSGELYRAWDGARFALFCGYNFRTIALGDFGKIRISLLVGGALTAAEYSSTALAYAYPSLILEPRAVLGVGETAASGPWLAIPIELMFRAGNHTIAPGASIGWLYRIGASQ
jgi:hypothetical protein